MIFPKRPTSQYNGRFQTRSLEMFAFILDSSEGTVRSLEMSLMSDLLERASHPGCDVSVSLMSLSAAVYVCVCVYVC